MTEPIDSVRALYLREMLLLTEDERMVETVRLYTEVAIALGPTDAGLGLRQLVALGAAVEVPRPPCAPNRGEAMSDLRETEHARMIREQEEAAEPAVAASRPAPSLRPSARRAARMTGPTDRELTRDEELVLAWARIHADPDERGGAMGVLNVWIADVSCGVADAIDHGMPRLRAVQRRVLAGADLARAVLDTMNPAPGRLGP